MSVESTQESMPLSRRGERLRGVMTTAIRGLAGVRRFGCRRRQMPRRRS